MPGFTTHYLFGQQTYQHLHTSGLKQNIQKYHKVFSLGLQGPDIFFYHFGSQFQRICPGSIVHTRSTGDFIKCLIEAPELFWYEDEKQAARAYAAGFIGHYALDTHVHPYVYCKAHKFLLKRRKRKLPGRI